MSRPLPSLLPDPNKWIDTSKPKKPTQRPLTSFATPPATIRRKQPQQPSNSSSVKAKAGPGPATQAKWKVINDFIDSPLPSQGGRQIKLLPNGLYTPPLTSSAIKNRSKKKRIDDHDDDQAKSPSKMPHGVEIRKRTTKSVWLRVDERKESRLKNRVDDFWKSDEDFEPVRSVDIKSVTRRKDDFPPARLLRPTRSAPSGSSSSASDHLDLGADDDGEVDTDNHANEGSSYIRSNSLIPSSQLKRPRAHTIHSPNVDSPRFASSRLMTSLYQTPDKGTSVVPSSTPYQVTPVPEDVLAKHRRLCGQDSGRKLKKKIPSPPQGRLHDEVEEQDQDQDGGGQEKSRTKEDQKRDRIAKRKRVDARELVDDRVKDRMKTDHKLDVQLVSSSPRREVLSPSSKRVFSLSPVDSKVHSPTGKRQLSRSPLGRLRTNAKSTKTPFNHTPSGSDANTIQRPSRGQDVHTPRTQSRTPSYPVRALAPPSPQYVGSPSPVSPSAYQRLPDRPDIESPIPCPITPTSKKRTVHEFQETLFVFPPVRPPALLSTDRRNKAEDENAFIPVSMEPETLLTWSIGVQSKESVHPVQDMIQTTDVDGNEKDLGTESNGYQGETMLIESELRGEMGNGMEESGWDLEGIEALRDIETTPRMTVPLGKINEGDSISDAEKKTPRKSGSLTSFRTPMKGIPDRTATFSQEIVNVRDQDRLDSPRGIIRNKSRTVSDPDANLGESLAPSSPSQPFPALFSSSPPGRRNRPEVVMMADTTGSRSATDKIFERRGGIPTTTHNVSSETLEAVSHTTEVVCKKYASESPPGNYIADGGGKARPPSDYHYTDTKELDSAIEELPNTLPSTPPTPLVSITIGDTAQIHPLRNNLFSPMKRVEDVEVTSGIKPLHAETKRNLVRRTGSSAGAGARWKSLQRGVLSLFTQPSQTSSPESQVSATSTSKSSLDRPRSSDKRRKTTIDAIDRAPSSTPKQPPFSTSTTSQRKQKKKKKNSPSQKHNPDSGSQLKLASFGFFPEVDMNNDTKGGTSFDVSWEQEPDLPLGINVHPEVSDGGHLTSDPRKDESRTDIAASRPKRGDERVSKERRGLKSLPQAPWHPSLRPAGIRELQRREALSQSYHGRTVDGPQIKSSSLPSGNQPVSLKSEEKLPSTSPSAKPSFNTSRVLQNDRDLEHVLGPESSPLFESQSDFSRSHKRAVTASTSRKNDGLSSSSSGGDGEVSSGSSLTTTDSEFAALDLGLGLGLGSQARDWWEKL